MITRTLLEQDGLAVVDYRCDAAPFTPRVVERHESFSLSYVRNGSFGCETRGETYELIAGSLLIGYPGDEFVCTHDHHAGGDQCISFQFAPEVADTIGDRSKWWRAGAMPPHSELVVLGELAQAAADATAGIALDEVAFLLARHFLRIASGTSPIPTAARERDRRRSIEAALWIDENAHHVIALQDIAKYVELSPYHFLRSFLRVVGITPHQYLLRARLRRAARMLAGDERTITAVAFDVGFGDLSNFIKTFRRAAGMSPSDFRSRSLRNRSRARPSLGTRSF